MFETAVGIIVPKPWKKPLKTPRTDSITSAGDNTLRAITHCGQSLIFAKKSAPKNVMQKAMSPTKIENDIAMKNTLFRFLNWFLALRADTILETARGRL